MDSIQILHSLKKVLGDACLGVFPSDKLPKTVPQPPWGLVVNTDPSNLPGTHWVAIYCSPDSVAYFDSYGQKPMVKSIKKWLVDYKTYWTNPKRIQGPASSVCGQYCVYFLVQRWQGMTNEKILKKFSGDLVENDLMITAWLNESFDVDCVTYDVEFLVKQICKSML